MLTIRLPDTNQPERAHAAQIVFGSLLGIEFRLLFEPRPDIVICLDVAAAPALSMPDVLFANGQEGWPRTATRPAGQLSYFSSSWAEDELQDLPVIFGRRSNDGQWWERSAAGAYFGVDVLGTAFWMMTQLEELVSPARDAHARFPGAASHAVRAGYVDRPLVDETVALLAAALRQLWPLFTGQPKRYALVVTHDVDRPFKHLFQSPVRLLRAMAADLVRRRDVRQIVTAPSRWLRVRRGPDEADPFFSFDWLMERSEQAGVRSAFYFICGHSGGSRDGDYEIGHPRMRALLRRIHSRGHEIGLHASYNSCRSAQTLSGELNKLRSICEEEGISQDRWGGRQHVLRFDSAATPAVWSAAGLAYDATLGFADVSGFRCGTCHPFPLYDHVRRCTLEVIERPLILMDATLMNLAYEGRDPEAALARIQLLRAACRRSAGEFMLLWHNCQLTAPAWRKVYEQTVGEAACAS